MKFATLTLLIAMVGLMPSAQAKELELDPMYVREDGAIVSIIGAHQIDPYFPTASLMLAQDNGLDVTKLAGGWINWMLKQQDTNGLFGRYCFKEGHTSYEQCEVADADDSMMAIWIELLYRMAPTSGMPDEWKKSIANAQYQLFSLYNPQANIYFISKAMPVGLLMDNVEVYASFKRIEREALRLGDGKTAMEFRSMAATLKKGIIANFWDGKNKRFIASTQARTELTFYPDTVVQVFPMLKNFSATNPVAQSRIYHQWIKAHRKEWFGLIGNTYPWGILAVLAEDRRDLKTASCWLEEVTPYRNQSYWSVLEETSYQVVEWKLENADVPDVNCSGESL